MRKKKIISIILVLCMLLSAFVTGIAPREAVYAKAMSMNQKEVTLIKGQSTQLSIENAKKKITWSSAKKNIASVDDTGYVVAKKEGQTVITAKVSGKKYTCKVTVKGSGLNYSDRVAYVGDTYQFEVFNAKGKVKWTSSKKSVAEVSSKGKVKIKKKGTATIKATVGKTTYTCKLTVKKASITKGQWISELLKKMNITIPKKMEDYSFSDIVGHKYAKEIQTAYELGILSYIDGEEFQPNASADREFVAVTAIKALGIDLSTAQALTCSDKNKITHQQEVSKAIEMSMLSVSKKKFNPLKEVTKKDKDKVLKVVKKYVDSTIVKKEVEKVTYLDEVLTYDISSFSNYEVVYGKDNNLTVKVPTNFETDKIEKGNILFLSEQNGNETAIKVDGLTSDGKGNVIVKGTTPKLEEVYETIDIEKSFTPSFNDFVPNENVLKAASSDKKSEIETDASIGEDKVYDFSQGNVSGKITLKAPEITTKIIADTSNGETGLSINQFLLTIKNQAVGEASIKGKLVSETVYLGKLDANLGKGFKAWVIFNLVFDSQGQATVKCTITNSICFNYFEGQVSSPTYKLDKSFEGTKAEVDAKMYLDANVKITWLGFWDDKKKEVTWDIEIAGLYFDIGVGGKAAVIEYGTAPKTCVDLTLYPYSAIRLEKEHGLGKIMTTISKNVTTKWTLLDNNADNPYIAVWHMEDGIKREGACSHSNDVYTIKLDACGGQLETKLLKVQANQHYGVIPRPEKNGYDFDGWYTARTGGEIVYGSVAKAKKSLTLYAHWKEGKNLKVSFDANGGTELTYEKKLYEIGKYYSNLPKVIRKNYEFADWYTSKLGGTRVTVGSKVERANQTLYARWEAMKLADGYYMSMYSEKNDDTKVWKGRVYPAMNSIQMNEGKLIIYGGISSYELDGDFVSGRKGYAWREIELASNYKGYEYDLESEEDEEEDPYIALSRSDVKDDIEALNYGDKIVFKIVNGKITELIFVIE